ncbi:hypothetical protein CSV69_10210 [Sporosarcina sp. P26b]|uniref:hypothetical protein n=1 Tax=Sporosarcina sp. P26b TaxID=2048253 RepID=UPI000C16D265|nr:hypothetical protein [Sporosarcina sp. P26b]PIC95704.1 hypothetical protein CSV69_10210 [Sporosarcina sp. P26b]
MPDNNPTIPTITTKKVTQPNELNQRLREKSGEMAERSRMAALEKKTATDEANPPQVVQQEQPKRKVVRPKKVRPDSKVVSEGNSKLEKKLGIGKRNRFEDANTRVTTYIDNDQLEQLRKIKKEYNVPMTEVIHKALAAYLTT